MRTQTPKTELLSLAGIARATGRSYGEIMRALAKADIEPAMIVDERQLFDAQALKVVRRILRAPGMPSGAPAGDAVC